MSKKSKTIVFEVQSFVVVDALAFGLFGCNGPAALGLLGPGHTTWS